MKVETRHESMPLKTSSGERFPKITGPQMLTNPSVDASYNHALQAELAEYKLMDVNKATLEMKEKMEVAIEKANEFIKSNIHYTSVRFAYHEASGYAYAVLRDQDSGEVIQTLPATELLDLAARLKHASGILLDVKG